MDEVAVFPILPASARTLWVAGGIAAVLGLVVIALASVPLLSRQARCEVGEHGIAIRSFLYGREIPFAELQLGEARAVDLRDERELRPRWRTNGIGLPGYQTGWFRLRDKRKALLFVTDPSRVLVVPTTNDWSLMVSVASPDALLEALRRAAGPD